MAGKQCAFYCAEHPWTAREGLLKVGFTANAGRRLFDDCYTTCFDGPWKYLFTLETATSEEAHRIEQGVLHALRFYRLAPRELVRLAAESVQRVALAVAATLGVTVNLRVCPAYPPAPAARRETEKAGCRAEDSEGAARDHAATLAAVEHHTLPALCAEHETTVEDGALDGLVDELLGWTLDEPRLDEPRLDEPRMDAPESEAPPKSWLAGLLSAGANKISAAFTGARAGSPEVKAPGAEEALFDELEEFVMVEALGDACSAAPFDYRAPPAPLQLRDYQVVATINCAQELRATGKCILSMACRTGKTGVAFEIMRNLLEPMSSRDGPVCALFLVPGLALARQTAQKLAAYGLQWPILIVGSDPRPVQLPGGRNATMTTNPATVGAFLSERGHRVVVSTYQSSALIGAAPIALTIFDEAHRVCGGTAPRPFNCVVQAPRTGARLFMTATPVYDSPAKTPITMKDREMFGGVAYRYYLRQGISAGHVNDFAVKLIAAPALAGGPASEESAAPAQICAAMAEVDKMLVFCRNIAHAARLAASLALVAETFEVHVVHSRMDPQAAAGALNRFAMPGVRAALLNVRMFQEGVEIPPLNAVFFAAPRHSPKDIIQSVCRPLNALEGKPPSVVFLPILHDPAAKPDDPANLKRFATIIPFVDALMEEDPRLYEHLLDPEEHPYPIDLAGTSALGLAGLKRSQMMKAFRQSVRFGASSAARPVDRLLRAENIPWETGFAELRRVVIECKRYPKTIDQIRVGKTAKANLHTLYRRYADQYKKAKAGEDTALEPYQVRALVELPLWDPFGVEGPYPWQLCLEFLRQWLVKNDGRMPMLCLENGGYVGLDATMMERLSGFATVCNQSDGKARKGSSDPRRGFTLAAWKERDLDELFAPWPHLRWKKLRDANNDLVPDGPKTCFQEAHARFKEYYKAHGKEGAYIRQWFEGYPEKHKRQENPDVGRDAVPLRKAGIRKRNYGPKDMSGKK